MKLISQAKRKHSVSSLKLMQHIWIYMKYVYNIVPNLFRGMLDEASASFKLAFPLGFRVISGTEGVILRRCRFVAEIYCAFYEIFKFIAFISVLDMCLRIYSVQSSVWVHRSVQCVYMNTGEEVSILGIR